MVTIHLVLLDDIFLMRFLQNSSITCLESLLVIRSSCFQHFSSKRAKNFSFILSDQKHLSTMSADWKNEKDKYLSLPNEEKRKEYKCGDKFVTLENITRWNAQCRRGSSQSEFSVNNKFNGKISLYVGDITALEIGSIVNAANARLAGGGGVDGAIHSAAGRDLLQGECQSIGGCETGNAVITGGYRLPSRYIIHTPGPVGEKPGPLQSCYKSCLNLLKDKNLGSIAFPCISTGVYGYPNRNAAEVALHTVRTWMESEQDYVEKHLDCIIFCLFMQQDIECYNELASKYFPA